MTRVLMDCDQQATLADDGTPRHRTSGAPQSRNKFGGKKTGHPEAERAKKAVSPTRQASKEKPRQQRQQNRGHPPSGRASQKRGLPGADPFQVRATAIGTAQNESRAWQRWIQTGGPGSGKIHIRRHRKSSREKIQARSCSLVVWSQKSSSVFGARSYLTPRSLNALSPSLASLRIAGVGSFSTWS